MLEEVYLVSSIFRDEDHMRAAASNYLLEKYVMKYIAFFCFMNYTTSRLGQQ